MTARLLAILSALAALAALLTVAPTAASAAVSGELYISEYIEGGSFNKAIEIANTTGADVDLSTYSVELYSNGASTASQSVTLSGSLADGDVFVIAHGSAAQAVLDVTDLESSAVANFNGDDAVVLRNGSAVVDSFGQVGVDPGSQWPGGGQNDTLRRMASICDGDTDETDAFDASAEWDIFPQDTFDGLGSHTADCSDPVVSTDLYLSEYVEGGSFNKAIEIANTTGADVDLSTYSVELYSNGTSAVTQSVTLSGSLADGDVFVIAHGSAAQAVQDVTDLVSSSVANFNGDDALVLRNGTAVVDSFGQVGVDPGSQWPGGGANDTLRRMASICDGDTDETDAFDASLEWDIFPQDTFDGLGSHDGCGGDPVTPAQPFPFIDNFTSDDCTDGGWQVVSVDADQGNTWSCSANFSNADVNGFGDTAPADEWLITPALNMNAQADEVLNFDSFTNFTDAAYPQLEVVYSSDYDGAGDPTAATWTALSGITFSPEGSGEWTASGAIDLSGISGSSVYFAFHYTSSGTGGGEAANWRIDSVEFAVDDGSTEPTAVLIHEIQGSGPVAALDGQTVVAQAIVTSLFESNDALDGFFIQEEDAQADADPATSEAVFVFCRFGAGCPSGLAVGDMVTVTGEVTEFNGMSQIDTGSGSIVIDGSGNDLPAATVVNLPAAGSTEAEATFENIEGMIVTIAGKLIASEYFNLGRYGEIVLTADERAEQFTDANAPDVAGYSAFLADLATRQIVLDDNNSNQFDARSGNEPFAPQLGGLSLSNKFRGGDSITDLTGVIHWNANAWRMRQIDAPYSFVSENPGTATPDDVGGTLKVASFNVLNYFVTLDNPGNTCGPAGLGCRGANSVAELDRQRAKIVSALVAMDADVVGLIEIENDAGAATADLITALNVELGAGTYDYVDTGTIGTDAIKQAFIYKPATVSAVGAFAVLDSSVDPAFIDDKNRPALIQTFEEVATGARVTVAVNHLKSKGSDCDSLGDPDLNDGQANCNLTRTAAAQALADYLATDPTGSGDVDSLIIGDLNAYAMEDPVTALEAAGYADMLEQFQGTDAYGYVFDGQLGYLDYAMANADLQPQVTGVTSWHINADEVNLFDYNDDVLDPGESNFFEPKSSALPIYAPDQFRSSDHDPVIVGLALSGGVPRCAGLEATIIGTDGRDRINGTNGPDVIVGLGGNDIINGLAGDDVICGGDGNDVINGSLGDDMIYGELGVDRLLGHNGNDYISGGFAADNISGGNGDDMLDGNDGNDRIVGNNGNDIMNGGAGRDVMNGLSGNDTMAGDGDNDRLIGGSGNDGLDGGDGTDNLNGSGGTDTCTTGEVIRSCEL
ncbi:MAG: ExeM/NucH family extracellular endonuclease [Acidimicrobiales bacterium]